LGHGALAFTCRQPGKCLLSLERIELELGAELHAVGPSPLATLGHTGHGWRGPGPVKIEVFGTCGRELTVDEIVPYM
jgi:hypothetical protein